MKVIAIIQARMGSSRLPGKVMKEINGKTVIELLHQRLSKSKKINKIVVATSNNKIDKTFKNFLLSKGVACEASHATPFDNKKFLKVLSILLFDVATTILLIFFDFDSR